MMCNDCCPTFISLPNSVVIPRGVAVSVLPGVHQKTVAVFVRDRVFNKGWVNGGWVYRVWVNRVGW